MTTTRPNGTPAREPSEREPRPRTSRLAAPVATVVVGGFLAFVVALIVMRDAPEIVWGRLIWIFSAVEAVAFGAAGFLFGSSIQRGRAENAEADAERNATDAANGRRLAASAEAIGVAAAAGGDDESSTVPYGPGRSPTDDMLTSLVQAHVRLAERLFPR